MHVSFLKEKNVYYITGSKFDLNKAELLYEPDFSSDDCLKDFEVSGGNWYTEEGWLVGEIKENRGGLIYTNRSFKDDVILDIYAQAVPPCDNDLNFSWHADGWNYEKQDASKGYIGGLGGWWLNRAGIEKYPECRLFSSTGVYPLESGKTYHIVAGSINGHCFIFADDELVIEVKDPSYETILDYGRVALGTYASKIRFKSFKVFKAEAEKTKFTYSEN